MVRALMPRGGGGMEVGMGPPEGANAGGGQPPPGPRVGAFRPAVAEAVAEAVAAKPAVVR